MKIFVSTTSGQGQRANDFCHVPEAEWVKFGMTCDRDIKDPDGGCGCGRAMVGVVSSKATTTFVVADLPVTTAEYRKQIRQSFEREGWDKYSTAKEFTEMVDEDAEELLRTAAIFPVGAVLEKRLDNIRVRQVLATLEVV